MSPRCRCGAVSPGAIAQQLRMEPLQSQNQQVNGDISLRRSCARLAHRAAATGRAGRRHMHQLRLRTLPDTHPHIFEPVFAAVLCVHAKVRRPFLHRSVRTDISSQVESAICKIDNMRDPACGDNATCFQRAHWPT